MRRFLYRGVSNAQHRSGDALVPKDLRPFDAPSLWNGGQWDVHTWDNSPTNAAIDHVHAAEHKEQDLTRSGISTSTSKRVARTFAFNHGKGGWVYTLSVARVERLGIKQAEMLKVLAIDDPKLPDKEVILYCDPPNRIDSRTIVCVERYLP